jgi:hypothetical protein
MRGAPALHLQVPVKSRVKHPASPVTLDLNGNTLSIETRANRVVPQLVSALPGTYVPDIRTSFLANN